MLLFIISTSAVYAAEINGSGTVKDDLLYVRAKRRLDDEIVGSLSDGASANIITKTGDWYEIELNGKSCYVHSDYLVASRRQTTSAPSAAGSAKGQAIVDYAKQFLGVPYVWGGTSPSGFDCSGLVYYVYGKFGVSLYRTADDMAFNGKEVPLDQMQPGDIVLFWNRERYSGIHHCGIYVGDGNFIHAPQTGDVVKITTLKTGYYSGTVYAARRIFD